MELNHRLYLYKPSGLAQDFLGELVVDNLQVDIKLQDISTVSFRIPKTINGEFNPRINQVLDSYVVELWYGRVQQTGAVDGVDYQKVRFRIYSTPLEFQEEKFLHSYAGYSIESDLEFKQIISWPGIKVQDFFRSIVYGNNTQSTLSGSVRTITQQGTFSETGITPAYTISTNTNGVRYITIPTTTLTASDLDIFIYENRRDVATDAESESSLIPFENVNGVESNLFKAGYYILNKNLDNVLSVSIALPDNLFDFDAFTTSQKVFTYSLYDNPISRRISIGINTDNIQPLSDMYINLAQDAAEGQPLVFGIAGGPNYTFTSQEIYTKNGLSLYQILLGHDMDLGVTYQSVFYPKGVIYNDILYSDGIVPEGILFNSGFYLGTITEIIAEKFRSNIEFNNITIYQAVKDIAESFESIAVFDTINKTVSFYAENEYGINNGLILKYGTYLKSVNKEIDSSKIVTSARALGKNNLKITLISPTGKEVWEDYSYFLDDFHIDFETKKTSVLSPLNPNINIAASNVRGIAAIYESDTGYQSRWLDIDVARTLASWQFARDYFHELMSGNLEDEEILFSSEYDHERYNGLYDIRNSAIELYVKYETEYENKKASEYKYAYLRDYYQEKYGGNNSTPEDLIRLNYYIGKYNESVEQTIDFKEEFIDPLYADIYDVTVEDSIAQRFSEVLSFLEKRKHFLIDNQPVTQEYFDNFIYPKIRPFVREYVHNDSKIDTEYDLLKSTKIYVDENKEPKVTININVADILAAYEAYDDWDKFKIGDKIYLYFPEFNIDLEAQIREFSVNFDSKTLSLVISTVRNYNRGFGKFILRNIKTLSNVNKNTVQFYQDDTVSNTNQREEVANILNNGINTTTTPVNTGASDTNGNSSTTTGGEGIVSNNIETVDPVTETLTFGSRQKGVRISDGRVLSYKPYVDGENLLFTQEIEVSAENGFVIRKVLNDANKTVQKQVYIDTNGNAVFAGTLEVGSDAYNQVVSLAGEGTTVFKAGSMSELNAIVTANINDLLLVSATFTDTTPEPDRVYIKDDIYRYDLVQTDPTNVYDWVLAADLKTKTSGSVGGWTINSEDIFSNNQKIVLHSDSGLITNGDNPYISIGQSSKAYQSNGIFLGFDNLFAKLSIVSDDNSLKWTGTKLSIKGDLEIGTTDAFYTTDKTSFASSTAGIFIGYDNAAYKLNIGDATKSLKWDGTDLTLTGNLSGSTGRFGSLTNTDYAVYLGDTTTPLEIKQDSTGNQIVYVNSNGNAKFGALEIISGTSIFSGDINTGNIVIDENGVIGYKNLYLKRTDIFFLAADKSINSTLTNLSIFKAGDLITVEGSLNNNFTYTVAGFDGLTNKVTVLENVVNESAGLPISLIGRTKFKLENSGVLSAVDINLESDDGRKTIRIGNLINQELVSTAGYYGFEITNRFGYYLNVTDLAFNGATKKITSTTTDLSVYLPGNRLRVRTPSGSPISTTYTVASVQGANELTVVQDIFTQAAGTAVDLTTAEPYKVSVTEEGFFITTVNALDSEDYALGIDYNSNRIWAKRLLISDTEDENDSSVLVGQISSSQYGVVTKYGINRAYVTSEGFKLTRMDGTNENPVFSVDTTGKVFATTLQVSGESKLAEWSVDNNAIYFGTEQTTGLDYSAANSMTFGVVDLGGGDKRPYISAPNFLLDRNGDATFRGTVFASAGNFINTVSIGSDTTNGTLSVGRTGSDKIIITGQDTSANTKIYTGSGPGAYNNANNKFYVDASGRFSLGEQVTWNGTDALTVQGVINAIGGNFVNTVTVGASADKISIKGGAVGSAANETKIYSGTGTFGQANTGFYLDSGGDFSLGNKLTWDNSSSLLSIEGDIGGTIGQIAVGDKVRITPAGIFGLSGVELPGDAANNFQLRASDGKLIAKSADIEGNITATTGTFAGSLVAAGGTFGSVSISSTGSLTVGTNITINNTDGIKGTDGTNTAFQLNPNGTGSIGGFSYNNESLTAGNISGNYIGMSKGIATGVPGSSNIAFWAGATSNTLANIAAAKFRVDNLGNVTADTANFGTYTFISGSGDYTYTRSESGSPNYTTTVYFGRFGLNYNYLPTPLTNASVATANGIVEVGKIIGEAQGVLGMKISDYEADLRIRSNSITYASRPTFTNRVYTFAEASGKLMVMPTSLSSLGSVTRTGSGDTTLNIGAFTLYDWLYIEIDRNGIQRAGAFFKLSDIGSVNDTGPWFTVTSAQLTNSTSLAQISVRKVTGSTNTLLFRFAVQAFTDYTVRIKNVPGW